MPAANPGEVWQVDFGLAAKVRPALLLTGLPAVEELDLATVLLQTTALLGNRWELSTRLSDHSKRETRASLPSDAISGVAPLPAERRLSDHCFNR